jgi:hypothetical protein
MRRLICIALSSNRASGTVSIAYLHIMSCGISCAEALKLWELWSFGDSSHNILLIRTVGDGSRKLLSRNMFRDKCVSRRALPCLHYALDSPQVRCLARSRRRRFCASYISAPWRICELVGESGTFVIHFRTKWRVCAQSLMFASEHLLRRLIVSAEARTYPFMDVPRRFSLSVARRQIRT